jgi:hypothetical protein
MNEQIAEILKEAILNSEKIYASDFASLLMREFGPKNNY